MTRERADQLDLPDESAMDLAGQLIGSGTSPSQRVVREEMRQRVREALVLQRRVDIAEIG